MQLPFLTPLAERISADGRVELVHEGGSLGRLRPKVCLLARDLCTFQVFEAETCPAAKDAKPPCCSPARRPPTSSAA